MIFMSHYPVLATHTGLLPWRWAKVENPPPVYLTPQEAN